MNGRQVFALILIAFGVFLLVGNIYNVDIGELFWPLLLVVGGLVLIFRPAAIFAPGVKNMIIGESEKFGEWTPEDEEVRLFVGDIERDYRDAHLPDGVRRLVVRAFVCEVNLSVPAEVGIRAVTNTFVTDGNINGNKKDYVFSGLRYQSDNYETAAKKLNVEVGAFVSEFKLRHA